MSSFQINKDSITKMFDPKNVELLNELGGLDQLFTELKSHPQTGLTSDSLQVQERAEYFGKNQLPPVPVTPLYKIMWEGLKDPTIVLLSVMAAVSLALGIYQDVATDSNISLEYDNDANPYMAVHPKVHFVEGLAILVAVVIVVLVGSLNDYKKEKQFQKLNQKKESRDIKVLRNGQISLLNVYDVMVGDIVQLEPGDILSTDGILISGHNLKCDESMATGESDAIKKSPYRNAWLESLPTPTPDPFLFSGSKVLEGVGEYLVVAVGQSSFFGRIMMNLREEDEATPLQKKLGDLAALISKVGITAAVLNVVVLLIIYFAGWADRSHESTDVMSTIVNILLAGITIVVVAVPEGLPLAVTLSLAFATIRMLKDNNLVRTLAACETMGNATTVCSDKTGTLTTNVMTVVSGTVGKDLNFDHRPTSSSMVSTSDLSKTLNPNLVNLIQENVSINSTAFESGETHSLVGSKTECALIQLTASWTSFSLSDLRHRYPITQVFPFSSERKMMSTLIQLPDAHYKFRLFVKGASEMVLAKSTKIVNLNSQELDVLEFENNEKSRTEQTIMEYAERSLRTIGLAYVDIQLSEKQISMYGSIDPQEQSEFWTNWLYNNKSDDPSDQLIWIGVVGIEDPLREGVVEAVKACERSGVIVRMVTGDNVLTAKAIATQCGILTPGGIVMEGPKFRELSDYEMNKVVPKLQVLARSSPQDKMILVKKLKALGHIVAVTGDGTNDGPALKSADIGFSMGISGTEVAKEASSIVLMDDNFASIVKAIMWGRMVNDSIKKFLQFQLTINFSAILIAFISSVISSKNQSVLSVVQLLWVNLIMDTLAALALATDVPDDDILDRPPDRRDAPLITDTMWKMIGCQGLLQTIMCFALLYGGRNLVPKLRNTKFTFEMAITDDTLGTIVFNTFVLLQLFNEINCRRIDNKLNVFKNLFKNYYFLSIVIGSFIFQLVIVQWGGVAFSTLPLSWDQWLICIALGLISLPLGLVVRLLPLEKYIAKITGFRRSRKAELLSEKDSSVDKMYNDYFLSNFNYHLEDDKRQLIRSEKAEMQNAREMGFFAFALAPSLMATTVGINHSSTNGSGSISSEEINGSQ